MTHDPNVEHTIDLDAIEARAAAATKGPWFTIDPSKAESAFILGHGEGDSIAGFEPTGPWVSEAQASADLSFVANARADVPALVAEVRRLSAILSALPRAAVLPSEMPEWWLTFINNIWSEKSGEKDAKEYWTVLCAHIAEQHAGQGLVEPSEGVPVWFADQLAGIVQANGGEHGVEVTDAIEFYRILRLRFGQQHVELAAQIIDPEAWGKPNAFAINNSDRDEARDKARAILSALPCAGVLPKDVISKLAEKIWVEFAANAKPDNGSFVSVPWIEETIADFVQQHAGQGLVEPRRVDFSALGKYISDYLDNYEFRGDGDHVPTDGERVLITDAMVGLLDEQFFARFGIPAPGNAALVPMPEQMPSSVFRWLDHNMKGGWVVPVIFYQALRDLHFGTTTLLPLPPIKELSVDLQKVIDDWRGEVNEGRELALYLHTRFGQQPDAKVEAQANVDIPAELHPESQRLVIQFASALAAKLRKAEVKYEYSDGWRTEEWEVDCRTNLREHLEKGDPLDVAIYAAFLWARGWPTFDPTDITRCSDCKGRGERIHSQYAAMQWRRCETCHGTGKATPPSAPDQALRERVVKVATKLRLATLCLQEFVKKEKKRGYTVLYEAAYHDPVYQAKEQLEQAVDAILAAQPAPKPEVTLPTRWIGYRKDSLGGWENYAIFSNETAAIAWRESFPAGAAVIRIVPSTSVPAKE